MRVAKLRAIFLGWWAYLFQRRSQMGNDRLSVCDQCAFRKGFMCGSCGCFLPAKAEVEDEDCPKGYWPENIKGQENESPGPSIGK